MVEALLMALLALVQWIYIPVSWYLFQQPLVAGFWVGLILGDPVKGAMIGATINIAYLGWITAGGAQPSDKQWAGLMGTYIAMKAGVPFEQSLALAIPIGILGNYVHVAWMTLGSIWPQLMDKLASKGNYKAIRLVQLLGGPLLNVILRALPVFLICFFGTQYIEIALDALPAWAMNGLSVAGKMMPAIGMSMLFKYMYKRKLLPFFIIGFAIAAYTGMTDLLLYVIIAVAIAILLVQLGFGSEKKEEVPQ